ncbi:MAG: pyridoxal phosphate-dependent decarboxylase family protein [Flavobacteriales bacterium]|jgi:sulfinoalanine decarboxylase|tara:strand:- start:4307 stop:5701 length:1395 start_codon:yes stop_codon:yes gene_type:complete
MLNNIKEDLKLFNEIVDNFLEDEKTTPISKSIKIKDLYNKIDLSLSDEPSIQAEFKQTLKKLVLSTPKSSSKMFFNQLFGGRHSKAVLGDLLAVMLNNSMATYKISGPQAAVEKEILSKVCELIKYPKSAGGTFPTGGSMSNFMSLIIARDQKSNDIINKGFKQKFVAYSSEESHYSVAKNASFSGLGKNNVRYIKCNSFGQLDTISLENQIREDITNDCIPFYINATAGTTVLCAFDNIDEISRICKKYSIWLHVDGAFGGSVIFTDKYKNLVKGVEKSDSFCFNAHKTLGVPLSTSILVVRESKMISDSFKNDASYLYQTHDIDYNLGYNSFECGRRNNALKFWTMWKSIGTKGICNIINHEFDLADYARSYTIMNKDYILYSFEKSLSICFNYKNYDPIDLCTKLYEKNKIMVGFGYFRKKCFIRLVTINGENSKSEILDFFKTLEVFCQQYHQDIKKISN